MLSIHQTRLQEATDRSTVASTFYHRQTIRPDICMRSRRMCLYMWRRCDMCEYRLSIRHWVHYIVFHCRDNPRIKILFQSGYRPYCVRNQILTVTNLSSVT